MKPLALRLNNGKTVDMYMEQTDYDDGRTITTCFLHFSPTEFHFTVGERWCSGHAIKHPGDVSDPVRARQLAFRRALESLERMVGVKLSKEAWTELRRARYDAEAAAAFLTCDDAVAVSDFLPDYIHYWSSGVGDAAEREATQRRLELEAKYPYKASECTPRTEGGPTYRNVYVLCDDGVESIGWCADLIEWIVYNPDGRCPVGPADVGVCFRYGADVIRWGEIDDYSKLAEELSQRSGDGTN
jgi:hypothetical protein